MILPPMLTAPYEDREIECEMAVENAVFDVIDQAVAMGWGRKEAMAALANVVLNEMFAEQENHEPTYRVAQALGKVEH